MRVKFKKLAGWQSGHAADCKSVYAGSIPASASISIELIYNNFYFLCPGGGIGRHKGFKIPRRQLRAGSSPALGTISHIKELFFILYMNVI